MDYFIYSNIFKYIGLGIIESLLFVFLGFSFFVYLNGREMKEYYRILFGKLQPRDIRYILLLSFVVCFYNVASNLDNIMINAKESEFKYDNIGKVENKDNGIYQAIIKFIEDPKITINRNVDYRYDETAKKYFPMWEEDKKKFNRR